MPNLMSINLLISLFYLAVRHFFAQATVDLTRLVWLKLFTRFLPGWSQEQQRSESKTFWVLVLAGGLFLPKDPKGQRSGDWEGR